MSLDLKYRPIRYDEVLGQEGTVRILREYVKDRHGYQQSYLFGGPWGSGKTTLARILARALLCENPKEGEPCDECRSCKIMLERPDSHECYIEHDAANNSGKADIARIVDEIKYGTFSGQQKIYLFDECFTEDTMLVTPEGPRSIRDLVERRYNGVVVSFDSHTGERCWKPVTNWYDIEDERDCVTLEFDNGTVLTVTVDQELFTKNRGWVRASRLLDSDILCELDLCWGTYDVYVFAKSPESVTLQGSLRVLRRLFPSFSMRDLYELVRGTSKNSVFRKVSETRRVELQEGLAKAGLGVHVDPLWEEREENLPQLELQRGPKLIRRTWVGKKKVYDLTVADTHSFFAYSLLGGHKHALLAHNCHELSKQAFDAMLKPMEDSRPGSEDKLLVCIFCTTEPGKMRAAVTSRCAPVFTIRACPPERIAQRLGQICQAEGITADSEALVLIAEAVECHIRDAIKAVEGVAHLGPVTVANAREYLHLDAHSIYLELLEALGTDIQKLVERSKAVMQRVSPATAYENMASLSLLAYQFASLGVGNVPSYLDKAKLKEVGQRHGSFLVEVGSCLASRPSRVSATMLVCDLISLHHLATGQVTTVVQTQTPVEIAPGQVPPFPTPTGEPLRETAFAGEVSRGPERVARKPEPAAKPVEELGTVKGHVTSDGVYVDPRAQRTRQTSSGSPRSSATLSPAVFSERLDERLQELADENGGSTGWRHLDRS